MIKYLNEAYRPEEKVVFNYMIIKSALESILKEQKFPTDIEIALYEIYKNFQVNSEKLLNLYLNIENRLPLDKLLLDLREEKDVLLSNSGLDQPLLEESEAVMNLIKFIIEVDLVYMQESQEFLDSIPGFHWDLESFRKYFNSIKERCERYANE